MLHNGVSLIPVLVIVVFLNLLLLQLVLLHHELTVESQNMSFTFYNTHYSELKLWEQLNLYGSLMMPL